MAPILQQNPIKTVDLTSPTPTCLKKVITTRQFVLMALGSSIGAGLLLSTGQGQYSL